MQEALFTKAHGKLLILLKGKIGRTNEKGDWTLEEFGNGTK